MPEMIFFTDNYQDHSTRDGYQFEFFCRRCGNGQTSSFQHSITGFGGRLLKMGGDLVGGGVGERAQQLGWDAWAEQLNLVLREMHALLWPDLIVLCGGITEEPEKFMDKLHCEARLCVGTLRSEAGIVGAALATVV